MGKSTFNRACKENQAGDELDQAQKCFDWFYHCHSNQMINRWHIFKNVSRKIPTGVSTFLETIDPGVI